MRDPATSSVRQTSRRAAAADMEPVERRSDSMTAGRRRRARFFQTGDSGWLGLRDRHPHAVLAWEDHNVRRKHARRLRRDWRAARLLHETPDLVAALRTRVHAPDRTPCPPRHKRGGDSARRSGIGVRSDPGDARRVRDRSLHCACIRGGDACGVGWANRL